MISPVKKNNDGSFWISEDFYFGEMAKMEAKADDLKEIIKRLKDENYTLEKENTEIREQLVELLKSLGS